MSGRNRLAVAAGILLGLALAAAPFLRYAAPHHHPDATKGEAPCASHP